MLVLLLLSTGLIATKYNRLPPIKKEIVYFDVIGAKLSEVTLECNGFKLERKNDSLEGTWVNKTPTLVTQCQLKMAIQINRCTENLKLDFSILEKMTLNYKGKCQRQLNLLCLRGLHMQKQHVETECSLKVL